MAKKSTLDMGVLGKVYQDGAVIVRQGETGDCMYVIQEGQVEVVADEGGKEVRLAVLGERNFFGEMAIFEREVRTATVRALGPVRALTVDRKTFLRRIHQDPSLAFHIVQTMSQRIRELDAEVTRLRGGE
jgi:CRP/FNR family transcriptional regulator